MDIFDSTENLISELLAGSFPELHIGAHPRTSTIDSGARVASS